MTHDYCPSGPAFHDGNAGDGEPTAPPAYRSLLFGARGRGGAGTTPSTGNRLTTKGAALFAAPFWMNNKRRVVIFACLMVLLTMMVIFLSNSQNRVGLQRIWQFWSNVTPWILEYKWKKFKWNRIDKLPADQIESQLAEFHQRTAEKSVNLVQKMGGIYVKLGQVISTMGTGILHDDYIRAMQPLQDGIPPRSLDEISTIFERSTGKSLEDAFEWIDEKPIGAASIAQAHKAILKKPINNNHNAKSNKKEEDDIVIVKIQYPEVAKLFNADLNNLEIVTRMLVPGSLDMVKAVRERHSRELDFHSEADHLRECRHNLQQHNNIEPNLVRIPVVRNETGLCTSEVLVMEFLEGQSLNTAIEQEQDRMARALGKEDGKALREFVLERIGEHLEQTHANSTEAGGHDYFDENHPHNRLLERIVTSNVGASMFRAYVGFRDRIDRIQYGLGNLLFVRRNNGQRRLQSTKPPAVRVPMGRILKTLVRVHGLQMLRDGVWNADPHGGNLIVMKDGRLGLLDYGMVGRATPHQRKQMAKVILGLAKRDTASVNAVYKDNGYRASWNEGDVFDNPEIVRRFASFHFDRFDMSPVPLTGTTRTKTSSDRPSSKRRRRGKHDNDNSLDGDADATEQQHQSAATTTFRSSASSSSTTAALAVAPPSLSTKPTKRSLRVIEILDSTIEWSVPDWIEQGRRLTGILAGVSLQAGRPMSMAKEWSSIAQEVLEELEDVEANDHGGVEVEKNAD